MKILIIGGCGYIGSRLYKHLESYGGVDTVDLEWHGNFSNPDNLNIDYKFLTKDFLKKYQHIVLLAAHSSVQMCQDNLLPVFKNNVSNFVDLLTLVNEGQSLIYASSSSVYGNISADYVDESCDEFIPYNYYDLSKQQIDAYAKLSDKSFFGLRFGTVNGPSPNFRRDIMINAMTCSGIKDKKVKCFNGETNRPILSIDDLVMAIGRIIEKGDHSNRGIYNLASFNSTAGEIADKVAGCLGIVCEDVDENKSNEVPDNPKLKSKYYDFSIDCSKFEKEFDFEFKGTVESITTAIVNEFSRINLTHRADAKLY